MQTKVLSVEKVNISDDVIITIEYTPGWFLRLFGVLATTIKYRGSCTVWHEYPSGRRAGSGIESMLYCKWTKWKWSQEK